MRLLGSEQAGIGGASIEFADEKLMLVEGR